MDATQMISDSILESDEEENEEEIENKRGRPLAKLCILKNEHIPETDLPLFLGDNVLGRDSNTCTLTLSAPSVSKQHATICISVYRGRCHSEVDTEALVWDLGSMNGTRKGRLKLTPNVRYALSDGDSLVLADIPCQYVSCAVKAVSSQADMRTPVSRNLGVKARLPDALGQTGTETSTGSKKSVNRDTKAVVSLTKTPVRTSCLSFEETPTQPQGTLVPESDSESEDERLRGGVRGHKPLVSDSDSHKSSPTCSTFVSPFNKIVPESEDDSPFMSSCSTKSRSYRNVSLSKEETETDIGQQQLRQKQALAIVDDSEEEQGREEERVTPGEKESDKNGPAKQESNVSFTEDDVCKPEDAIPAFNMDSDTDVEGEEEGLASADPVTLNTNKVNEPPNTDQFHMDSDTDAEVDEDALENAPKTVPSSNDTIRPSCVIQPKGITVDSDTDVDDDAAVSDAATKPMSFQSACTADSGPSRQPKDFCLDSDTDVDEEEVGECGKNKPSYKIDAHTKLDIKSVGPKSTSAAPHSLHLDSDTDNEAIPTPAVSEPPLVFAATESSTSAQADLDILSDSDTDVEADSPLVIPVAITSLSVSPVNMSEAPQSESDADTDESSLPPAGDVGNPADLRVSSGIDVHNQETDIQEAGEDQIPELCREETPGMQLPLLQNCSTPVQFSEGNLENMETQAFLSPSSVPLRCVTAPAVALSSCSESQEEDDFVVAETQSFVLQARGSQGNPADDHIMNPIHVFGLEPSDDEKDERSSNGRSFHLGLSDSSHLHCQAQSLAMESTQAFVPVNRDVNLEDTQAYALVSTTDCCRTPGENAPNLEATQSHGLGEDNVRCLVMSEKEGKVDLALEATQAYISEPYCDSEDEKDTNAETQPLDCPTSSTLALTETLSMSAFEEEGSLATDKPVCSAQYVKSRTQKETDGREEHVEVAQFQERLLSEAVSVAETQPMHTSDDVEGSDEHSFVQTLTNSELSAAETQPMVAAEDIESDDDLIPGSQKRKAKTLQLEEEETQPLINSELSIVETQPMHTGVAETRSLTTSGNYDVEAEEENASKLLNSEPSAAEIQPMDTVENGESDEDSIPLFRKRRAKPLQLEETQPSSISDMPAVETQPMGEPEDEKSSDEDSIPVSSKRKAKPLQLEDEQTQPLCNFVFAVETQHMAMGEDEESSDEEPIQSRRKRKAKPLMEESQSLTNSEVSTVEILSLETKIVEPPEREIALPSKPGSRVGENKDDVDLRKQEQEKMEEVNQETGRGKTKQEKVEEEQREKCEQLQRDMKEVEEQKSMDNAERIRFEEERAEKARKEQEEKERYDQIQKEKEEQLGRERRENDAKERIAHEKAEREMKDKIIREQKEKERKEHEEKERLETEKKELDLRLEMERKERQARLEREERETLEKEKEAKEKQIVEQQENVLKVPTRGRRAARRTTATQPEQDSTISTNDDVPARRTRSRSNSSNSVSSERSASSINTQESRGRGRGRGVKRTSEPPQAAITRSSNRRRTVAAGTSQKGSNDISPQGSHSESNLSNTRNSEVSSFSASSQIRGRGGRQRERGRKTEPDSIPSVSCQSDCNSDPKPAARGRRSKKALEHDVLQEDKPDSQQAVTTRGHQRFSANGSESAPADKEQHTNNEGCNASEESPVTKRNVRGRRLKEEAPSVSDGDEAKGKIVGGKRELQNTEGDTSSSSKISKGNEKVQTTEAAEEKGKDETEDENPVQTKRRGRASVAQAKKNAKECPPKMEVRESENMEVETVEKRARGRPSAAQKRKKEEQEDNSGMCVSSKTQDTNVVVSQTPTSIASRKRQTPVDSSPVAKSPRCSSPAASGRLRTASQGYKVLFTGVVDEAGERVLARLGGSIAKGVADMNCLVTDKVRRTVKFLCAVAKGIPIVTTHWLEKSGKAGSFLSPISFIVKDPEQEKKFSFSLQESLRTASSQPLLQGYEIHVTKSVKPEPVQMKDIITCSGATFLPKMPSSHKLQTLVISCEEDWPLCGPAVAASLPVVTAEFILTGILQQKLDFQTHTLSAPATNPQPAGGRGRGRKKT